MAALIRSVLPDSAGCVTDMVVVLISQNVLSFVFLIIYMNTVQTISIYSYTPLALLALCFSTSSLTENDERYMKM